MEYYAYPLNTSSLIKGKLHPAIDLRKSIHQNITLLLKSLQLSYRYDPTFGCIVGKYQGGTPPQRQSERLWREEIREAIQKNLLDMLQRYETRIRVDDVIVQMINPRARSASPSVKVRVEIKGQLTIGRREHFYYPDSEVDEDALEVLPLVIPVGRN